MAAGSEVRADSRNPRRDRSFRAHIIPVHTLISSGLAAGWIAPLRGEPHVYPRCHINGLPTGFIWIRCAVGDEHGIPWPDIGNLLGWDVLAWGWVSTWPATRDQDLTPAAAVPSAVQKPMQKTIVNNTHDRQGYMLHILALLDSICKQSCIFDLAVPDPRQTMNPLIILACLTQG